MNADELTHRIPLDGRHVTPEQAHVLLDELREVFQQLPEEKRVEMLAILRSSCWTWVN